MIRILYMSDLHLEMESWRIAKPSLRAFLRRKEPRHPIYGPRLDHAAPVDLVVLAGDIHNGLRGIVYADQVAKYLRAPVVYVAGNHEYYRRNIDLLLPTFRKTAAHTKGRVQFLENAVARFTFQDQTVNILGCTLWTDYTLHGDANTAMRDAARRMNDHALIQSQTGLFQPRDALARHETSRLWLHKTLGSLAESAPQAHNLIVTHHAPAAAYLGTRTGDIAPAYASELLAEFAPYHPTAWIHGHTHYRHDSIDTGIHLVSAPRGYIAYDPASARKYHPGLLQL
jgi:predicted MPP superfamily phosphohydrolase